MRELYIYWKVPRAQADAAAAAVRAAMATLAQAHPGLQARLLRRADEAGDAVTWMEIYAAAAGVTPALQAQIENTLAQVWQRLNAGPRHTEVFEAAA